MYVVYCVTKGKGQSSGRKYNMDSVSSNTSNKFDPELERENQAKEMLDKHRAFWLGWGPDHDFVKFVKIAPAKYVYDCLFWMDKEKVKLLAYDILIAAMENPDKDLSSGLKLRLNMFCDCHIP